jgi:hypothetical protein
MKVVWLLIMVGCLSQGLVRLSHSDLRYSDLSLIQTSILFGKLSFRVHSNFSGIQIIVFRSPGIYTEHSDSSR